MSELFLSIFGYCRVSLKPLVFGITLDTGLSNLKRQYISEFRLFIGLIMFDSILFFGHFSCILILSINNNISTFIISIITSL